MEKFGKPSNNFLVHFLENRKHSPCYSQIVNTISGTTFYSNSSQTPSPTIKIYDIHDAPGYLSGTVIQSKDNWKINKINTYKGTMIILKNYQDLTNYLTTTFSSNRRSKFRTYKKRLEDSFDISYKTYFGDISLSEYELLFDEFYQLMTTRFEQKQALNQDLKRWETYKEIGYPLIQKKEACLFVIYDGKKPISICFNIIYGKNIFAYIRAYDIDYSKFYVGFTDLINQLQWCFDNEFEVFDMLKGDYAYKSKWTDHEYFFERQIIYNSEDWFARIVANFRTRKIRFFYTLVNLLKKYNFHLIYRNLKDTYFGKSSTAEQNSGQKLVNIEKVESIPTHLNFETVNINEDDFSFLRKPVYDYLYSHREAVKDIEVSKIVGFPNSYFVKGSRSHQKLVIHN